MRRLKERVPGPGLHAPARTALALTAWLALAPALPAQVSLTCEFAVGAYFATQVELEAAKKAYRNCRREGRGACTEDLARVEGLRHRLKLSRDYLDRYCVR